MNFLVRIKHYKIFFNFKKINKINRSKFDGPSVLNLHMV